MKNLIGKKFNRWTIVKRAKRPKGHYHSYWICKCKCGTTREVREYLLTRNISKSCGCYDQERKTTHGMTNTLLFKKWSSMKNRCSNKKELTYKHYGGRGITVCKRWLNFQNFHDDMYESYKKHCKEHGGKNTQIDRINNNKNYEPNNCRWATSSQQANNKRNNHKIYINGKLYTITQAAKYFECTYDHILYEMKKANL